MQAQVEAQIFTLEGSYLSETGTHSGGNLIQGFENYLKNQTTGRRRTEAAEHDRIFSSSSLTYTRVRYINVVLRYDAYENSLWN